MLFERTEYKQTTFRAWNDWPGLELTNASRSVQNLLSQLTEINDFKVVFAPLKIDVVKWADTFQSKIETTAIVDSIQIGSLLLEEGVTAKVVIRSDTDVRNAYLKLTQDRKFSLQKIQLLIKGSHSSHVVLSNDGTARIDTSGSDENLVIALRASIQNVI